MAEPRLIVRKAARVLEVWDGDQLVRRYDVSLGFTPTGHKQREGDGRTPEGQYFICSKNPASRFHLSLGISYPNAADAQLGLDSGAISQATHDMIVEAMVRKGTPPWDSPLGGEVFIHGGGGPLGLDQKGSPRGNWTHGCVAIENDEIEELFSAIKIGTPVVIHP